MPLPPQIPAPLPPPFSDAELAALTKFNRIEIQSHTAGCARRELAEDVRSVQEVLRREAPGVMPGADLGRNPLTDAQRIAVSRTRALAQLRLDMLLAEQRATEERASSLHAARESVRDYLINSGVVRHGEID